MQPDSLDVYRVTWADFEAGIGRLAALVMPGRSGIFGIPRGGLPLAVALSHRTNLPLVERVEDKTLIVDDIADSGATLSAWPNNQRLVLVRRWGAKCRAQAAIYLPDGDKRWVLFPWENAANIERDKATYAAGE